MTTPQFNATINAAIQMAFTEGVSKCRMSAIEVAHVLSIHTQNVLTMWVQASNEAQIKQAAEIVIPLGRNLKPNGDGK